MSIGGWREVVLAAYLTLCHRCGWMLTDTGHRMARGRLEGRRPVDASPKVYDLGVHCPPGRILDLDVVSIFLLRNLQHSLPLFAAYKVLFVST
jgi:hypothetical protein